MELEEVTTLRELVLQQRFEIEKLKLLLQERNTSFECNQLVQLMRSNTSLQAQLSEHSLRLSTVNSEMERLQEQLSEEQQKTVRLQNQISVLETKYKENRETIYTEQRGLRIEQHNSNSSNFSPSNQPTMAVPPSPISCGECDSFISFTSSFLGEAEEIGTGTFLLPQSPHAEATQSNASVFLSTLSNQSEESFQHHISATSISLTASPICKRLRRINEHVNYQESSLSFETSPTVGTRKRPTSKRRRSTTLIRKRRRKSSEQENTKPKVSPQPFLLGANKNR